MPDWFTHQQLKLVPLSPIHVGTGEPLDWTQCVVDAGNARVVLFDESRIPEKVHAEINRQALQLVQTSIDGVKFIRGFQAAMKRLVGDIARAGAGEISILPALASTLDSNTGAGQARNEQRREAVQNLQVDRSMFDPRGGLAYVPGSSVKGAIRTSWADEKDPEISSRARFHEDPFSRVMLEDFRLERPVRTVIVSARSAKRTDPLRAALSVQAEVIRPGTEVSLVGGIRVREGDKAAGRPKIDDLLALTTRFHNGLWQSQREQLRLHVAEWWFRAMDALVNEVAGGRLPGMYLVRVGKFCTAESKTTRKRSIKVRVSRTEQARRPQGTTFWLADDVRRQTTSSAVPFGWALLVSAQAEVPLVQQILRSFEDQEPWSKARISVPTPSANAKGAATQSATVHPADDRLPMIVDLEQRAADKRLNADWLKACIRDAEKFEEVAHRHAVRKWIEEHLASKTACVPTYRKPEFTPLLQKLK
jgi:CRISPR-associated protein Csm5